MSTRMQPSEIHLFKVDDPCIIRTYSNIYGGFEPGFYWGTVTEIKKIEKEKYSDEYYEVSVKVSGGKFELGGTYGNDPIYSNLHKDSVPYGDFRIYPDLFSTRELVKSLIKETADLNSQFWNERKRANTLLEAIAALGLKK